MSSGYLLFSPFKKFNYKTTFFSFPGGKMARIKFRQKMGKETTCNFPLNRRRFREKKGEAPFSFHNFHIGIVIAWPPRGGEGVRFFLQVSASKKPTHTRRFPNNSHIHKERKSYSRGQFTRLSLFSGETDCSSPIKIPPLFARSRGSGTAAVFFFWGKTGLWKASPRIY